MTLARPGPRTQPIRQTTDPTAESAAPPAAAKGAGDESADTPGSVPGGGCPAPGDGHPSTTAVADCLQRSTRVLGRAALERTLSELAPGGVYLAGPVAWPAGGLLHHRFTLTAVPARPEGCVVHRGGLFSVALSRGSPRVAVGHHPALWSPDVPRRWLPTDATAWPTHPRARIGQPRRAPSTPCATGVADPPDIPPMGGRHLPEDVLTIARTGGSGDWPPHLARRPTWWEGPWPRHRTARDPAWSGCR